MSGKIQKILLGLLLILIAGWLYKQYFTPITNRNPTGENIIAFGNSITAGYQVDPDKNYVTCLERAFNVKIINAGVSGDTTSNALLRFKTDVLDKNPKVVLLELGGNDLLQRLPQQQTRENLEYMIQRIHEKGAAVVLLGVAGTLGAGTVADLMKDLAAQYNTACVPNILDGVLGRSKYMLDRVHPNAAGHELVAKNIAPALQREIPAVFER